MISAQFRGRHIHLIGIGGAGVGALAPLLIQAGATISGCDQQEGAGIAALRRQGITVHLGHAASHLEGVDLVVHTAAVDADHPELAEARRRGIAVMARGECLVRLMAGTRTLAVSGSHGKTSTTWMLGHLLAEAGLDPVVMVGGSVASLGGGARAGHGELFVAETDESDGSFASVEPTVAILTNLDREHLDHYGSYAALEDAFHAWFARMPSSATLILPVAGVGNRVVAGLSCRIIRCGLEEGDYHCAGLELGADGSRARIIAFGRDLGEVGVPLPGAHMVHNALMAIAAARQVAPDCDLGSLVRCERVRRRFTVHGVAHGVRVVEDYGHHPAEVRATIAAARLAGGRVHVIFQLHRYTRTRSCFAEFANAFDQAYAVAMLPIYAASEQPIAGVSAEKVAQAVAARREGFASLVLSAQSGEEAIRFVAQHAQPGDTCLVLGAGDVGDLAGPLLDFFAAPGHDHHVPEPTPLGVVNLC
jgi:UDP-N-acetylmuramate--alanine ligase